MARKRVVLAVVWALSLFIAGAFAHAHTATRLEGPSTLISGNDLAFRVEGHRGDHVTGTLMVRVDGTWRDAEPPRRVKPLSLK